MSLAFGLHRVSSPDLKRLLRALHRGALPSPITRSALIEKAFGHIEAQLDPLLGRDLPAAKALVIAVLAEREAERARGASLVYAAPFVPGTRARELGEQVRELVAGATQSAHVYGLRLELERGLLATLGALMRGRELKVRLVFDGAGLREPLAEVRDLVARKLPAGPALEVFVAQGARWRARAVVVDGDRVLVTSGELTANEDDECIDLGMLRSDSEYARALEAEWQRLLAAGKCKAVELGG